MKKEYTEFILQSYPASRSDDNILIYYHLRRFHFFDNPTPTTLRQISELTVSLYDLVRYRQKFQAQDKYLGTPEVMAKRRKNGDIRHKKEQEEKQIILKAPEPLFGQIS